MGRPPIGSAAREIVAACRITKEEKALLSARYGKPAMFFRAMIDREMAAGKNTQEPQQ